MIASTIAAHAPSAPGRLGVAVQAQETLHYLDALGTWRDQRRFELDQLDQAALESPDRDALTGDVLLSMALWKAVADRHDLLLATWDSGRVGPAERERLATLIWGRLDAALAPDLAARAGSAGAGGALAVSLPEACRLSDALAASLRARLLLDGGDADVTARVRSLRAQVERLRDLVDREPARTRDEATAKLTRLDRRVTDVVDRAKRGADVGGLLPPLEADAARAERDLIVGSANRRNDARDAERARGLQAQLRARGLAVRALADRCVREVRPAPRLGVPDVGALGPVPDEPAAVDAFLLRLDAVSRALGLAQAAYQSALDERDTLRSRLDGYAASRTARPGQRQAGGDNDDLAELVRRGQQALASTPSEVARARSLVAAYQAYLSSGGGDG